MTRLTIALFLLLASTTEDRQTHSMFPIELPGLFSDNMVLRRNFAAPFWGKATPGDTVTINGDWGASAVTVVQADGTWRTTLKTSDAGGPYEVSITIGDTTIVCKDVLLGEVWVCSGQSNMELALEGSLMSRVDSSTGEIASANYPDVRFFTVGRAISARPEFNCTGTWTRCSPVTAAKFSAVGYFFARKLHTELGVPIGVINASWGGTYLQSWMSLDALSGLTGHKDEVAKIERFQQDIDRRKAWIRSHRSMTARTDPISGSPEDLDFEDTFCASRDLNDARWYTIRLPAFWWETPLREFDGAVWFRRCLEIPKPWVDRPLEIRLGRIHGEDETWINGKRVGTGSGSGYWSPPRVYEIPADLVQDSLLTIAVRIIDRDPGGETWGDGSQFEVSLKVDSTQKVPLSGDWKYLPVAEYVAGTLYIYGLKECVFNERPQLPIGLGPNTPTMLYNGMIAPIIPFGIRGVIWYQGESNADVPENYNNYRYHFPHLINQWRVDWGQGDFPFYWVQLAPWNYWANWNSYMVRDAQRRSLSLPNTGMAVTLDIGDLSAIHPPNKHDVGLRLALWALAEDYGRDVAYSGPIYQSMRAVNGKAFISFMHSDGGLVLKPIQGKTNLIIAGKDGIFVKADAEVSGEELVVFSPYVEHPVAVRYAWGNADEATLFNGAGLPAATFRTDEWAR